MSTILRRAILASSLAAATAFIAPAASADQAATDCAKLNAVVTQDEGKLDTDAQGLQGHIHTLIHAARLVSADADTMSTDITNAHVATPGLAAPATQFASAIHDLGGALKTLIGALEPLAGNTATHVPGLHQRIQTLTTDVAQRCPATNKSPDCTALLAKMRDFPQDTSGSTTMAAMGDKIDAYATSVSALPITDPNLKKDRDDWAKIGHDLVAGLRGVAQFQSQMDPLKQRGEAAAASMKSFCSSHMPASSSTSSNNPPPPPPPPPPPAH